MDRSLLLATYASVLEPGSARYCSAPITSGRAYFAWLDAEGLDISDVDQADPAQRAAHTAAVITPNRDRAHAVVQRLRREVASPVIDPTAIPHVPAWSQPDWLAFWEAVIERFAQSATFLDGWQYSYGCTQEYAFARRLGMPTYDERGQVLASGTACQLITGAIAEIRRRRGSTRQLEQALAAIAAGDLAVHRPANRPAAALHPVE